MLTMALEIALDASQKCRNRDDCVHTASALAHMKASSLIVKIQSLTML